MKVLRLVVGGAAVMVVTVALLYLLAIALVPDFVEVPYACGGTQTVTPDGVLHCTGGVP